MTTPTVESQQIFATGTSIGATAPDSITITGSPGSIWVEYGDGASSTGGNKHNTSTIVQYSVSANGMKGTVENTYTAAGLADGLVYNPATGNVWVLNNNDGNSTLQFINPTTNQISNPLTYGSPYVYGKKTSTRGFDDVVFGANGVFLSETNPVNPGDPVIVQLQNGQAPVGPLQTTPFLSFGDTGTWINPPPPPGGGPPQPLPNQPLPITDPDSLKLLPNGDLLLTGEADGAYIFVHNPGMSNQTVSFVTLPTGDVPDDAIMATSMSGTFYISNQGGNDILSVQVTGLTPGFLYADITAGPNANELLQIDPNTGMTAQVTGITGLNSPHGLAFVPDPVVAGDPPTSSLAVNNASTTTGVAGDPPTSSLGVNNAVTTTPGAQNPGLDHAVALFNQSMAAGFPEQHGGQITTNALSQITTNEQPFLANPHHG